MPKTPTLTVSLYSCQPSVTYAPDPSAPNYTLTRFLPTFYLDPRVQGILSLQQAERIVLSIVDPTGDPTLTVHPNVVEVY